MRVPPYVKLIADVLIASVYAAGSHNCNIIRCVPVVHARSTQAALGRLLRWSVW